MGLTSKFYCKHCEQIKSRFQVKYADEYAGYHYDCKYCHKEVEPVERMLVRLDKESHAYRMKNEIHNMKEWVKNEAHTLYPKDKWAREAFSKGVYRLLDSIGFDYSD